jgi:hypothetical protein
MSLKRSALVLAFLSCTLTAAADTHKIDGEAAIAYAELSHVFGFKTSFARTLGAEGKLHSWAVEGQFTGHFLGDDDSEIGAFLGLRRSWGTAHYLDAEMQRQESKRMLFVHALGGVTHRTDALGVTTDDPALALGAGYDIMFGESYRTGVRFAFDWVIAGGEDFPRASIGLVYRVPYPKGAHQGH